MANERETPSVGFLLDTRSAHVVDSDIWQSCFSVQSFELSVRRAEKRSRGFFPAPRAEAMIHHKDVINAQRLLFGRCRRRGVSFSRQTLTLPSQRFD